MQAYRVYGLQLTTNLVFPDLVEDGGAQPASDVHLEVVSESSLSPLDDSATVLTSPVSGRPMLTVCPSLKGLVLQYARLQFEISSDLHEVVCRRLARVSDALVRHLFLGLVCSYVLNGRGRYGLHASAVAFSDAAIAFVAPAGSGKSSLAAFFVCRGHRLVSDDIVALVVSDHEVQAAAGPPVLRLLPDAAQELFADAATGVDDPLGGEKRQVSVAYPQVAGGDSDLFRLAGLYALEVGDQSGPLKRLSMRETLMLLAASVFGNFLSSPGTLSRQLECLARVAEAVPSYRVPLSHDYASLAEVHDAIVAAHGQP